MDVTGFPMGICSKSLNSSDFKSISLRMPSYVKRKLIILNIDFSSSQKMVLMKYISLLATNLCYFFSPPRESKELIFNLTCLAKM